MTKALSHIDEDGKAKMVDVSSKADTAREASAEATVFLSEEAFGLITRGDAPKGDVLATARIAGIMAAKKTSELIPLCHPLALSHAGVEFTPLPEQNAFRILATAKTNGPTGVEMEALTAASVAALTIYDMVKAVDRTAHIENIRILSKSGGKSGTFVRKNEEKQPAAKSPARRTSAGAAPTVLMHETSAQKQGAPIVNERDALRGFMVSQRLRVSDWAKSADVPVGEVYAFLSGRSRALNRETSEKLARAARSSVDVMFGRNAR